MKILPKFDSRSKDFSFADFGQVTSFEKEYNVDKPLNDDIQESGDVRCVLFSILDVAEDKEGVEYDIDELTSRVKIGKYGTDPKTVFKEVIKNGLLPKGGTIRFKPFNSFWTAHTGQYDAFDNVRSSLILAKYPVLVWGSWYFNWLGGILEKGQSFSNYHCTDADGWTTRMGKLKLIEIEGEPMISLEAWTGRKYYFTREVFNWWAKTYGFDTAVLSTVEINARRDKKIMESIIDIYKNIIILMQELLAQKKKI